MNHKVCALVGGQFGSEGKGLIAGHIAKQYPHHVRVGAANAGHTLYTREAPHNTEAGPTETWQKHVMQQIPCAAYANPAAALYVGPGAVISTEIFERELDLLQDWRADRAMGPVTVWVDYRAHVISDEQIEAEQDTGLAERIGSTSTIAREGIGVAAADRVLRAERCQLVLDAKEDPESMFCRSDIRVDDVPRLLSSVRGILLEGTQGTGLSNTTGYFPYCTSRNTTAAGLLADAGVAPTKLDRVILVCRTFPIRVAGNSGPFAPGSDEIDWSDIEVNSENERTTVTKKIRRVATFSMAQIEEAVALNGATEIALTFADYMDQRLYGQTEPGTLNGSPVAGLINTIQRVTSLPVTFVGTGPHSLIEL